jgi:lysozyme
MARILNKLVSWIKGKGKMKISKAMITALTGIEGSRSYMYKDSAGYETIGVGHLIIKDSVDTNLKEVTGFDGHEIDGNTLLSSEQIAKLLALDLKVFEVGVEEVISVDMTQNQFDALVCFAYNIGLKSFKGSSVVKSFNKHEIHEAGQNLMLWYNIRNPTTGALTKSNGLFNRRTFEKNVLIFPEVNLDPAAFSRKSDLVLVNGWLATYRKLFREEMGL